MFRPASTVSAYWRCSINSGDAIVLQCDGPVRTLETCAELTLQFLVEHLGDNTVSRPAFEQLVIERLPLADVTFAPLLVQLANLGRLCADDCVWTSKPPAQVLHGLALVGE